MDFTQPHRQSPKGIIIIFAYNALKFFRNFFAIITVVIFTLIKNKSFAGLGFSGIILVIVAIMVVLLVVSILKYLNFKFHLTESEFHLATGIINKENIVIPKPKIQNVYIKQSFLQQLINVASVKIETAGDKESEIEISALDKSTAESLKKQLFERATSEIEDVQTVEESSEFFKVTTKRLLLEGILHNHLASFAIISSFVFGLYYEVKEVIGDSEILDENMARLEDGSIFSSIMSVVLMILFVLFVSILFSLIRIFIVNFDLRVIENQKAIEISKGLFNKLSLILTPHKIQTVIIKTNKIKQAFNLYSLQARQAMTNEKQSKQFGIIALEKTQLHYLVNKLLKGYEFSEEKYKPEAYFKRVLIIRALVFIVILNVVGFLLFRNDAFWMDFFLVPLAIIFIHLRYKKAHYQVSDRFVTVGSGAFDTITSILEINKIQAVRFSQSFFQKRKDIASIVVYTASNQLTIPFIKEKHAKVIYDFLLFKVESQGADWM